VQCRSAHLEKAVEKSYCATANTALTGSAAPIATPRTSGEQPPTVRRNCPGSNFYLPSSSNSIIISGEILNSMVLLSPGVSRTR
jgi:hypothetical protein